jgi:hypothetical protein
MAIYGVRPSWDCWNRKALQHFDFVAFTTENRRPLLRKMLWLDWNYLGISRDWREKYIEFLKLREIAPALHV